MGSLVHVKDDQEFSYPGPGLGQVGSNVYVVLRVHHLVAVPEDGKSHCSKIKGTISCQID